MLSNPTYSIFGDREVERISHQSPTNSNKPKSNILTMVALSLTHPFNAYITKYNIEIKNYNTVNTYKLHTCHNCLIWSSLALLPTLKSHSLRSFFTTSSSFSLDSFKVQMFLTIMT